jgi:hypothetical protein
MLKFLIQGMLGLLMLFSFVGIAGFTAGVVTRVLPDARCINSECANPCKTSARFVRHAGCLK